LDAQTWEELQSLPKEASVRVFEKAGKGWTFADGKLLLVKDSELTILKGRRSFVIAKSVISNVEMRRRDPPLEGALIGAVTGILLGSLGGWQGCSDSKCVAAGITVYAGLGTLIDWRIQNKRTVYRAP
jgi:hypothetical protein